MPYTLRFQGSSVSIMQNWGQSKKTAVQKYRYLISPDLMLLLKKIEDKDFDEEIFDRLNDDEKRLSIRIAKLLSGGFVVPDNMSLAICKFEQPLVSQLKIIEKAIKAGNISESLLNEYKSIITLLKDHGSMGRTQGGHMISKIERTIAAFRKQNAQAQSSTG